MHHFKLEVKEAASLLGMTERNLQMGIKTGRFTADVIASRGGRGGMKYLVPLSSLPLSAQVEYLKGKGIVPSHQTVVATSKQCEPIAKPSAEPFSETAGKEALAKVDVLRAWQYCKGEAKGRTVAEVLADFLESYNTGALMADIYDVLGPVSRGTLYRWEKAYKASGGDYRVLAPEPNSRRGGKTKVTYEEANLLLGQLLHQNRVKIDTAVKFTKYALKKQGVQSPSSSRTLRRFADEFKRRHYDLWVAVREGEKALNDKVLPYIKRDSSLLDVGDVLVADGHRLNFQVINPYTGRPCRAVLVGFYDWASRDLLGYEIMVEENTQVVAGALRNAIFELGKLPKAVLLDNGKAFKAKVFTSELNFETCGFYGMFARLGIITSFAWPYNAQSKPIERFFGTFSDSFERLMPSFIGSSIEDKPAYMRRNEKFLKALHDDWVPTIPEAMALITKWREFYRSQPHGGLKDHKHGNTPGEVLAAGKGQGIDTRELDYLMLSVETASIGRNGIRFLGNEYFHEALYGFREKVFIRYSFFDLSQVFVYSMTNEYLCAARMVEPVHPMAQLTGNAVTMDAVKEGIRRKRSLKRQTLKVVKMAKAVGGGDVTLPWHEIVPSVPRIAEHIESLEADRRAETTSLTDTVTVEDGEAAFARFEEERPRIYQYAFERYEDLLEKGELTQEEEDWIAEFKATDEYKYSYTMGGQRHEG